MNPSPPRIARREPPDKAALREAAQFLADAFYQAIENMMARALAEQQPAALYLSRKDAAARLGLSVAELDRMRFAGELDAVKRGRAVRISAASVGEAAARMERAS